MALAVLQAAKASGNTIAGTTFLINNAHMRQIIHEDYVPARIDTQHPTCDDVAGKPGIEALDAGLSVLGRILGPEAATVGIMMACVDKKFYVRGRVPLVGATGQP